MADRALFQHAYLVRDLRRSIEVWSSVFGAGPFALAPNHETDTFTYRGTTVEADVSYATVYSGFQVMGPVSVPVSLTARSNTTYDQEYTVVGSVEYRRGGLRLAGEYNTAKDNYSLSMSGLPFPIPDTTRTDGPHRRRGSSVAKAAARGRHPDPAPDFAESEPHSGGE